MTANLTEATATDLVDEVTKRLEQASAARGAAHLALAKGAESGVSLSSLTEKLNTVAEAEGAVEAWEMASKVVRAALSQDANLNRDALVGRLLRAQVQFLSYGANDSYSGRTNDAQRAKFDGFRKAVDRLGLAFL